jgi:hypothetical protein
MAQKGRSSSKDRDPAARLVLGKAGRLSQERPASSALPPPASQILLEAPSKGFLTSQASSWPCLAPERETLTLERLLCGLQGGPTCRASEEGVTPERVRRYFSGTATPEWRRSF